MQILSFSLDLYEVRTLRDAIAFGVACRRHWDCRIKSLSLRSAKGPACGNLHPAIHPSKHKVLHRKCWSNAVSVALCHQLAARRSHRSSQGVFFLLSLPGLTRQSIWRHPEGVTRESIFQSTILPVENKGATRSLQHNFNNRPLRSLPVDSRV